MGNRVSLDGAWSFTSEGVTRDLNVPGSWQSQAPDLRHYSGEGIYLRRFEVPKEWDGKSVLLHFGAVDWYCEVSVNGKPVGSHEGGYTPFALHIEDVAAFGGENEVIVRVLDPGPGKPIDRFDYAEIPHGKQSWYGLVSGIWQSVFVEAKEKLHIRRIKISPDVDAGRVDVAVSLSVPAADNASLLLRVLDPEGDEVVLTQVGLTIGAAEWTAGLSIAKPKLWSPEEPNLYRVEAQVLQDGYVVDERSDVFGMRKVEVKDGQLRLNNRSIYLISALDQDFYPKTHYTPPSEEYIRAQFVKAKELGLNSLRCHIKVPDPRYLRMADEVGLLIWYEIPNWDNLTDYAKNTAKKMLSEMIERDWNHPSLVIISIINEEWGMKPREFADHRAWLAEMYDYAKSFNSGRLIVDNSPCGDSIHVKTDIEDFHTYYQIPEHSAEFDRWIADFATHPKWTFSQHGDAQRSGQEALVFSEFGNWGLPSLKRIRDFYGGDPWWMGTGLNVPKGADERFDAWGLDKVFGDWDGMAEALQDQEWRALKYQIEQMRRYSSIVGYVITEFMDLQWECNGLLDYLRGEKSFHHRMGTIQAQDIIVPEGCNCSYYEGEGFELPITISHFSQTPIQGWELRWKISDLGMSGFIEDVTVDTAEAKRIGVIRARLPEIDDSARVFVDLHLADENGHIRARNTHEFVVISDQDAHVTVRERIYAPAIADLLASRGARVASDIAEALIVVAERLDATTMAAVQAGASAIILASDQDALAEVRTGLEIRSRQENGWHGDWCNSAIWFKPELFRGLPNRELLDFSFSDAYPAHVITGVDPEKDRDDILSGIFVGWVNNPAAIAVGLRHGGGKVLVTTLPLLSVYDKSPFATAALNRLMAFVTSPQFAPRLALGP